MATEQQSAGTLTGAMIGSSVGSLFGSMADGPRGDWWGTAIGTIAGAAIGNAVNSPNRSSNRPADNRMKESTSEAYVSRADSYASLPQDNGETDMMQQLDIRNIKFVDEDHNLKINPQEHCKLIFEIYNVGSIAAHNVTSLITAGQQKKHLFMSQPVRIERIDPGQGLRYTVSIYADNGLKTGSVPFNIYLISDEQKSQLVRIFELQCENPEK